MFLLTADSTGLMECQKQCYGVRLNRRSIEHAGIGCTVLSDISMLRMSAEHLVPPNTCKGNFSVIIENASGAMTDLIVLEDFDADRVQLGLKVPVRLV